MTLTLHTVEGNREVRVTIVELGGEWSDCYSIDIEGRPRQMTCPMVKPVCEWAVARKVQRMTGEAIAEALGEKPGLTEQITYGEDGTITGDTLANDDATGEAVKAECEKVLRYLVDLDGREADIKARRDGYVSRFDSMLSAVKSVRSHILWKYEKLFTQLSELKGTGKTKRVVTDHGTVTQNTPAKGKWELKDGADEQAVCAMLYRAGLKDAVKMVPKLAVSGLLPGQAKQVLDLTNGQLVYTEPVTQTKVKTIGQSKEDTDDE